MKLQSCNNKMALKFPCNNRHNLLNRYVNCSFVIHAMLNSRTRNLPGGSYHPTRISWISPDQTLVSELLRDPSDPRDPPFLEGHNILTQTGAQKGGAQLSRDERRATGEPTSCCEKLRHKKRKTFFFIHIVLLTNQIKIMM